MVMRLTTNNFRIHRLLVVTPEKSLCQPVNGRFPVNNSWVTTIHWQAVKGRIFQEVTINSQEEVKDLTIHHLTIRQ